MIVAAYTTGSDMDKVELDFINPTPYSLVDSYQVLAAIQGFDIVDTRLNMRTMYVRTITNGAGTA
jgi:hypothetical protein